MAVHFAKLVAIKEQKDERRYKQREIADGIGVSERMVSSWMKGADLANIPLKTAAKVARWLDVPITVLTGETQLNEEPTS